MSFASEQYLKWAEQQFEQTGIENEYYSPCGGGSVNPFKKYKRDVPELTPQAIEAYKIIDSRINNKHSNLLTPESIAQEKRLDQYHKDCKTMPEAEARKRYLNRTQ